jgi:hypothetical protein
MRTTIRLDDALLEQAKQEAARRREILFFTKASAP